MQGLGTSGIETFEPSSVYIHMTSRTLKELKSLAPWAWDTKSKHAPGVSALKDFEKVIYAIKFNASRVLSHDSW